MAVPMALESSSAPSASVLGKPRTWTTSARCSRVLRCSLPHDGDALGVRWDGAAEQAEQHSVPCMEPWRPRERVWARVGTGNTEPDLDPEVAVAAGAAQAGESHHRVAGEERNLRSEVEQMAAPRAGV